MIAHWLLGVLAIIIMAILTISVGKGYLLAETKRFEKINKQSEEILQERNYETTLSKVENISNNLKLIVQVSSRQVVFSQLIQQVGKAMPPNTVLLDFDITKVDGGIDLTAEAKSDADATQVQVNLTDPNNKLFEKVDIVSVTCDPSTNPKYPCKVILRALFTKDNPFLFVNQTKNKDTQ
jgi:hypothetical protein